MYFQSYQFLFLFLPFTLICYFLAEKYINKGVGKVVLIMMSFVFYSMFQLSYGIILLSILLLNYGIHCLLCYLKKNRVKNFLFYLGVGGNILLLLYFKYSNFMIENFNQYSGTEIPLFEVILPVGISFITFQQLAFLAETMKAEESKPCPLKDFILYSSFFPYMTSGPITLPVDMLPQLKEKSLGILNWENISQGLGLFSLGLAKKILLADVFGRATQTGFSDVWKLDGLSAIIVMLSYTFQIYFDFSGYSDMAIGIARMFNIQIPENFNNPYKSKNLLEFWERWHMTLTRFLTKYVYIPLGGNRRGQRITYRNTVLVFLISGVWHGANWTFLIWGLLHGVFFIGTKLCIQKINKIPSWIQWFVTFGFLNVTWSIFRSDSLLQALYFFNRFRYFEGFHIQDSVLSAFGGIWQLCFYFVLAFYFSLKVPEAARVVEKKYTGWLPVLILVLLLYTSLLSFSKVSTFVYFQF